MGSEKKAIKFFLLYSSIVIKKVFKKLKKKVQGQ